MKPCYALIPIVDVPDILFLFKKKRVKIWILFRFYGHTFTGLLSAQHGGYMTSGRLKMKATIYDIRKNGFFLFFSVRALRLIGEKNRQWRRCFLLSPKQQEKGQWSFSSFSSFSSDSISFKIHPSSSGPSQGIHCCTLSLSVCVYIHYTICHSYQTLAK